MLVAFRNIYNDKHFPIMLAVLIVLPFILFYPSLDYEALSLLDDEWLVFGNEGIRDFSIKGIIHLFLYDKKDLHYMPFTYVSYSIDYFFVGNNPFYFRLHNLLLHITSGLLMFIFIQLLTKNKWTAFITSFIFLIHPINIESIVWISNRKQSLFLCHMLLSLIFYKLYLELDDNKNSKYIYLFALLFWIVSMLSKATAITLPGIFVLLYLHKNRNAIDIKMIIRQVLPTLPIIILFWYLNKLANDRNILSRDFSYSNFEHFIFAGYSYSYYWLKSLFPYPLATFYPAPSEHLPVPIYFYYSFLLSCLLFALMLYHFIKKQNTLFFALAYYTISILPLLNLMFYPLGDIPMLVANRYFYHSCLGIILYIILIMNEIISNNMFKKALLFSYITMFVILFNIHLPVWKNEIRVFENNVQYYPSEDFLYKLAIMYDKKGETKKAFNCLDRADALGTDIWINNIWVFYRERSLLYLKYKKYDKALKDINSALDKKDYKIPSYDSMLEMDKRKIELEMQDN